MSFLLALNSMDYITLFVPGDQILRVDYVLGLKATETWCLDKICELAWTPCVGLHGANTFMS